MARQIVDQPDEKWLIKRIQSCVRNGINSDEGEVTDVRQTVFNAYMGDLLGNEREGHSTIVTREVLQAIEWALPALMRVFLGGVKAVSFRPSGPDDVEQAKHETDIVNYWFFDGNPNQSGFIILYTYLKDLLLNPNAYMSVEAVEEEDRDTRTYSALNDAQIDELRESGADVSITKEYEQPDPMTGAILEVSDVTVTTVKTVKRVEVSALPPDKVIVDHNHHQLDVDTARAVIVRELKTLSDLRKIGYDIEADELGPDEDGEVWNDEETNRLFYTDEQEQTDHDESTDLEADTEVWTHTCYMRVDWDGDGISELRRVVMAGCKIIENEEWELSPLIAGSAILIPHKHVGMGYGELVLDLQQLFTTLTRQLLDNIYGQNIQRKYINENALLSDGTTMDALIDGTQETILVRGRPAENVLFEQITPIADQIVGAIEAMKDTPQLRTGVAPQLSLDPSVLEKATMGAWVGALEQASQRLELLARLVAETGLKKVFLKIHHTLRTHFDEPQQIEVNGKWVTVDPRQWKKRSSMTCNVGLGFNNKQTMLMLLQSLLAIQKEAISSGLSDVKKIHATLDLLVEQANLGHVGTFFNDPKDPAFKPPEPKPTPQDQVYLAQAEALKAESKRKDAELKLKADEQNEKAEAEAAKLMNELLGLKGKDALTVAQIAEIRAKITNLNMDKNAQEGPAEDSADDEFARAGGLVDDTAGERQAERDVKAKPAPKPASKPVNGSAAV